MSDLDLAAILPHLREGDEITAKFRGDRSTLTITGTLWVSAHPGLVGILLLGSEWVRRSDGRQGTHLTAIVSAPAAEERARDAETPRWADDPTIVMVEDRQESRYVRWEDRPDQWYCVGSAEASIETAELIERGARPVARYITAEPETGPGYVIEPKWCAAGVGGGEICARPKGHDGDHDPDAEPEPSAEREHTDDCDCGPGGFGCCMPGDCWCHEPAAEPVPACDRDHEPPIGSVVRDREWKLWKQEEPGWRRPVLDYWSPWPILWDLHGPLTLVEDGTNTGAGQ